MKNNMFLQNGKPTNLLIGIGIGGFLLLMVLMTVMDNKKVQETSGYFQADTNATKQERESNFKTGKDYNYLQKEELNVLLNNQLKPILDEALDRQSQELDNRQIDMLHTLRNENDIKINELKQAINEQNQKINEIQKTRNNPNNSRIISSYTPSNNTGSGGGAANQGQPVYNPYTNEYEYSDSTTYDPSFEMPVGSKIVINNFKSNNNPIVQGSNTKLNPGFINAKGVPTGTMLTGKLITGCVSSTKPSPIVVELQEDFIYENKVLIPQGTKLVGEGETDYQARKIFLNLDRLVINNREIEIKAHLLDEDDNPGFCDKYVNLIMRKFWPIATLNFISGYCQSLKDVSYYTSTTTGVPTKIYDDTPRNAVADGLSQSVSEWSQLLMNDASSQNAIILVYKQDVKIFIDDKILLDKFTRRE